MGRKGFRAQAFAQIGILGICTRAQTGAQRIRPKHPGQLGGPTVAGAWGWPGKGMASRWKCMQA